MQRTALWAVLAGALALAGCNSHSDIDKKGVSSITAEICGDELEYPLEPKRVVTHDVGITELFLYAGLGDSLVGYSGIPNGKEIDPQWRSALQAVPNLSTQGMNLETIIKAQADFVFGGWGYGFRQGQVTPQLLADHGVASYVLTESCIRVKARSEVHLEDIFHDLRQLGRIFRRSEQVEARIGVLQAQLTTLRAQMQGNTERRRVFVYDSGDKLPTTSGRYGMPRAMVHEAGGVNVFDDILSSWPKGNWEDVVQRDPEWIVIVDYGSVSAEEKIAFLRSKPELSKVSAIANNRFFVMTYAEAVPSPRNIITTQRMAAAFHPQRGITVQALDVSRLP